jgi:uncharacterized membrane protein YkvA (DUF1232 family)
MVPIAEAMKVPIGPRAATSDLVAPAVGRPGRLWHDRHVDLGLPVAVVAAVLLLWVAVLVLLWIMRPRDVPVRELIRVVPDIVRLLRALIGDRTVPPDVRLVLVGLIAWILSPVDLIPEFIPGLGPLDDVVVAVLAMRYVRRRLGVEGIRRRWRGTDAGFSLLVRVIGA